MDPLKKQGQPTACVMAGGAAVIGGRGTEEISEWPQGGFCIHDLHAY